jgi:hypothetical protein
VRRTSSRLCPAALYRHINQAVQAASVMTVTGAPTLKQAQKLIGMPSERACSPTR